MQNVIKNYIKEMARNKTRRRRMQLVVSTLSLAVMVTVFWQLRIVGISMTGEALCGYLEHTHTQQCLVMKPVCGLEESEGHKHTDDCNTSERVQICQKEEHTHVEGECYVLDVSECGREEHEHGDACFEIKTSLTCGQEEHEGHKHTDDCKREAYGCGYEKEHKHTLLCYSDVNADLETASNWEKLIPALNRKPAEDLAMVARTQIGYAESQRNYKVAEDGETKRGYTRYGAWYGNPYGDWNAMFVSFCLNYAEHPAYETLKNSGAETMRLAAVDAQVYQAASGAVPYVGDLAFLDKDSNGTCDTVAIVSEREEGAMTLVEGDCGGVVAENQYSLDNGTILGYALLTPQTATIELTDGQKLTAAKPSADAAKSSDAPEDENVLPADEDSITVTFVINNPDYTADPGSDDTHVTVSLAEKNNPTAERYVTGEGLTYTSWTNDGQKYKHKITGTGTLMRCTIPAGTTLAQHGYGLPGIGVTDIGNGNTYSYVSSRSWVTEDKMICNADTVFTENTTLYLSLYPSGAVYNLNWVCNCDGTDASAGSHSVYYNLRSSYPSPSFALGESLAANYILSAEDVNSTYTGTESCNVGSSHNKVFTGWYLKNETTKEETPLAAGVSFQKAYVDPNSSYTIKVYAHWKEAEIPETVTATFVNGEEQNEDTFNSGDKLGNKLPAVTAPEDKIFLGWKIGDTENYANAETEITADTIYTAVFADKVTVTFINGTETVETRYLAVNTAVGELPEVTASDKSFQGWVQLLENGETGTQYLESGTVITGDATYVPVFTDLVSITFMNGGVQFGETISVPVGTVLWSYLPTENPDYSGASEAPMEFSGWKINDTDNFVTEQTVAKSGMVLHAAFEEVTGFAIYLHDIAPDGVTDYETEEGYQISQTNLEVGKTLAQELAENPYYMIHDNALASECKWYIKQLVDGVETYTEYDLAAEVTSELHLYTFNYSVTLTREEATATASFLDLFAVASAAEVEVNGNTLTLTLREGERPTAADFVINGVDYALYNWTYYDENGQEQTLDISDIIANGVKKSITATSTTGTGTDLPISEITVNFYASIDDAWTKIQTTKMSAVQSGGRYHLSAAQLESAYARFGFKAEEIDSADDYVFAHVDRNGVWVWICEPTQLDGKWFIPGLSHPGEVDIYYLPNNTSEPNGGKNRENYTADNVFYSVTVFDSANLIYQADEDIPPVRYVEKGEDISVTLLDPSEASSAYWLYNGNKLTGGTSNGDGTTTYTFSNVTSPIRLSAYMDNLFDISYNINLEGFRPTSTVPTINGADTYTEAVQVEADGSYVIRTPSRTQFTISGDNALKTVVFAGWAVNGEPTRILNAGASLSGTELKAYGSVLNLVAQWEDAGTYGSVSFYVNLNCEAIDYSGSTGTVPDTSNDDYTEAIYGTNLDISPLPTTYPLTDANNFEGRGGRVVISDTDTAEADKEIRKLATQSVQAKYGDYDDYLEREFTLATFPNDELILSKIREIQKTYIAAYEAWRGRNPGRTVEDYREADSAKNKIIAIDGAYIPAEEITSANYTIRWVVFKCEGNGWHIDGTLVKKQAQMTITKTFYGETEAINSVKESYSIDILGINEANPESKVGRPTLYTLTLAPETSQTDNTETDQLEQGYRSYDAATNTYTWVISLTADWKAFVHEQNYVYEGAQIATLAEYTASNFTDPAMNTAGMTAYPEGGGIEVAAKAHGVDEDYRTYETVNLFNTYVSKDMVPISKMDDYGNPLTGVSFSLYKGKERCKIYIDESTGTYYYFADANIPAELNVREVTSGLITVNAQGYAMVTGLRATDDQGNYINADYTFKLEETVVPEGYTPIEDIEFEITDEGAIQLKATTEDATLLDGSVIRVINASRTMDVTVVKQWLSDPQEVQVQLTQNGNPLTAKTATLNEEAGWTHTWKDLPVYVNGKKAEYSIRENWIGNTAYSGSYGDGFENYLVTVSKPVTVDENNDGTPESATITVTNRVYEGGLQFTKVDEKGNGLSGAVFQLFTDEACVNEYSIGELSDLYGNVNFGSLAAGTYYMKEVRTPAGYQENTTVYKIAVTGSGTTITVADDETNTPISTIVNIPATASLKVKKVDGSGKPLSGAKFQVFQKTGETWTEIERNNMNIFEVDENGRLTVPGLAPGDYKLVEYQAPAGYYRMTEEIYFNVALSKIVALDVRTDENGNRVEDTTNCWSFDGETITVTNVTGSELPHTGGMGTHIGTMAGLLLMLSSLMYGFLLRRKRERGAV